MARRRSGPSRTELGARPQTGLVPLAVAALPCRRGPGGRQSGAGRRSVSGGVRRPLPRAREETGETDDATESWTAATVALAREAIAALLDADRERDARRIWDRLSAGIRERGAFRLIEAQLLLAEGDKTAARAVFDAGFEVADLREGAETLHEVWASLTDDPLPEEYDYRMRPGD